MANKDNYEKTTKPGELKKKCNKCGKGAFEVIKIQRPKKRFRIRCLNTDCQHEQMLGESQGK